MAILNLQNTHFMMRKNYCILHISHFRVCELREGEKENAFHFSYLSESSRNLKKKYTVFRPYCRSIKREALWWHGMDVPLPPSF